MKQSRTKTTYSLQANTWGDNNKRYTIRRFNANTYEVETVSEFREFKTLEEARTARKQMK
ncbi:hypothetical protein [Heyndrickxia faecalis]|uniref:DUF7447 family protein n=1 Tax=Heyndrickxia faecalis TaxID=2824910 RepID=UPI003D20021C